MGSDGLCGASAMDFGTSLVARRTSPQPEREVGTLHGKVQRTHEPCGDGRKGKGAAIAMEPVTWIIDSAELCVTALRLLWGAHASIIAPNTLNFRVRMTVDVQG